MKLKIEGAFAGRFAGEELANVVVPLDRKGLAITLDGEPTNLLGLEGLIVPLSGEEAERENSEGLSTNVLLAEAIFGVAEFLGPDEGSGVTGSARWRSLLFVSCQNLATLLTPLEVIWVF